MVVFRVVAALLFFGVAACVGLWLVTGRRTYLGWALFIVKLMVALGIAFFGILLLERVV